MSDQPYHVLVVEDNEADIFLIKRALREYAIPAYVRVFTDGETALEFIRDGSNPRPHAVILDLAIPRIEGVEVLRGILNRPGLVEVPVMVFTSSPSPSDRHRVQLLSRVRYVQKPTGVDQFIRQVAENVQSMLLDGQGKPEATST